MYYIKWGLKIYIWFLSIVENVGQSERKETTEITQTQEI